MGKNERIPAPHENTRTNAWDSTAKYAHSEISKGNVSNAEKIVQGLPSNHPEREKLEQRIKDSKR